MSHQYRPVNWNPFKKRFDAWMLAGVLVYLGTFVAVSLAAVPDGQAFAPMQILIRATGTLAFLMLSLLLCIGPLARLSPRFKPWLYNRRHLGVTLFLVALVHAVLVTIWYHGFGVIDPFVSLLVSNPRYDDWRQFPFEILGIAALLVLLLMAATSHDFWNANLGPGLWKAIHMAVYVAFALLVAHVALGALQSEDHPAYAASLAIAVSVVAALHLYTGWFASGDRASPAQADGWLRVGAVDEIHEGRAKIVQAAGGERIAVFRHAGTVAAVSNVCRHQAGPLGEGRVIDGCIVCPWHGYQYRLEDGCSPPPFTERIATYRTRVERRVVWVHHRPLPPGTARPLSPIEDPSA